MKKSVRVIQSHADAGFPLGILSLALALLIQPHAQLAEGIIDRDTGH
jgi:hypothetical protein